MGRDIVEGRWTELREYLKAWWERLSDADLERIEGKREALVSLLEEKYGYAKPAAQAELGRRLREYQIDRLLAQRPAGRSTRGAGRPDEARHRGGSVPHVGLTSPHINVT